MRILLHTICFTAISLLLGGCLEITETYTINPDGSGKVVHEAVFPINGLDTGKDIPPDVQLKQEILSELKHAEGVEVWDNVSYRYADEDKIYFKGTAYFKDLSKVKFHNSGTTITILDDIVFSNEKGQLSLELKSSRTDEKNDEDNEKAKVNQGPELTQAEVEKELFETKKKVNQIKMMLAGLFSDLKVDRNFIMPGTIDHSSNFELNPDGSVRSNFKGSKLVELITAKLDNEEWLRQQIRSGQDVEEESIPEEHALHGHLFGQKAPVLVVMSNAKAPLFNYEKEAAEARIHYQNLLAILDPLRLPAPIKIDPATIGEFSVAGVRYIAFDDAENGIQPLGYRQGYTVAVVGTLPEKAMKLLPGKLETALTDTGISLLPERDMDRKISWPRLSNDGRTVLLELEMSNPDKEVKSLKKLSGTLSYLVSRGEFSMIDLGVNKFEKGVKGNNFGAEVITASTDSLEILVEVVKESIKSAALFDEQGNKVDAIFSYSWTTTYTFLKFSPMSQNEKLPTKGKVLLEMLADFKVHEIEFELTDIPLLGR